MYYYNTALGLIRICVDGNFNMISIPLIPIEDVESASVWIPIVNAYRYETILTDDQKIDLDITKSIKIIIYGGIDIDNSI